MIYWLCLICCIQSSYFASPLVRTKHKMYRSQANRIQPGIHNELGSFNFDKSNKNTRSLEERFPWLKYNKAIDSSQNNNKHYFIQTRNSNRKFNPRRGYQNAAEIFNSAVPHIKSYDPSQDSSFIQSRTAKQDGTYFDSQNKNQEPEATKSSRESMRKPKIPEKPIQFGSAQRKESNSNNNDASLFSSGIQTGESEENAAMLENTESNDLLGSIQTAKTGASNKGGKKRNHHHKKAHKKKHNNGHHFGNSNSNTFHQMAAPGSRQNEKSGMDSNNRPKSDSRNPNENVKNVDALNVPLDGQDVIPFELTLPNFSKTDEMFAQNDILEDQQPMDSSFGVGEEPENVSFQKKDSNHPEEVGEIQNKKNIRFKGDDLSSDKKFDAPNFMQSNILPDYEQSIESATTQEEFQKSPNNINAEKIKSPSNNLEFKDQTESTTKKNIKESTEMYKPINFKLEEDSQLLGKPESSIENLKDQTKLLNQLLERRGASTEVNSTKSSKEASSTKPSNIGLGNATSYSMADDQVLSSLLEDGDSYSSPFSITQQEHIDGEITKRKFQKKASPFENFNDFSIESRSDLYKYSKNAQNNVHNKRSNLNIAMISSTFSPVLSTAMRHYRKATPALFENSMSDDKFVENGVPFQNEQDINLINDYESDTNRRSKEENITFALDQVSDISTIQSQSDKIFNVMERFANTSSDLDDEISSTTPMIQEYAKPTLGIKDKIMKKLSDDQKRSYQHTHFSYPDIHLFPMQYRNKKYLPYVNNGNVDDNITQIKSRDVKQRENNKNYIDVKNSRKAEMNNYMQSPNREMIDKSKIVNNKPNDNIALSKRNDHYDDKISSVYEGSKTKQTVVKDTRSNKETNVIENQKEKIVDNIHLIKEAKLKLGGNEGGGKNQSSATELPSDEEDLYPDYYETEGENAENESNVKNKVPIDLKKSKQGQDNNFKIPLPIEKFENSKFGNENNLDSSEFGLNDKIYPQNFKYNDKPEKFAAKKTDTNGNTSYGKSNASDKSKANLILKSSLNKPTEEYEEYYDLADKNDISQSMVVEISTASFSQLFPENNDYESQYPKRDGYNGENELKTQTDNLEPPSDYQPEPQEPKSNEQSSIMQSQKSNIEQSTDDFIDLDEQEVKKGDVLEELDKFPTGKANSKPKTAQIPTNMRPGPKEQRERQRTFMEFSTILPNAEDIGEFQREEKIERQSKVILKNRGIVRNGTASLFGEKKIEIKDNKQNYHETFMEEKGESKYPSEPDESGLQKRDNVSETPMKTRQIPAKVFPRQENIRNYPMNSDNSLMKPLDQNYEDERQFSQPEKVIKDAEYTNDDEYKNNDYYYTSEDNPDSTIEVPHDPDNDYLEYVAEPEDVWQNEGNIDGISKRSGALIDVSKLMRNAKYMRSSQLSTEPSGGIHGNSELMEELEVAEVDNTSNIETSSGRSSRNIEEMNTSDKVSQVTVDAFTLASTVESSTGRYMRRSFKLRKSKKQMEHHNVPKHDTWHSPDLHREDELPEKAMKTRRENARENSTRTANSGSGNIVYVTVRTTTDKESQFHDFLQYQEVGRRSWKPQRHLDNVYHRQKKHPQEHKANVHLNNYRHNN